ncbi:N-acetylmuramoyl-L-alanine amidase [Tenacibaculum maritimum]|nr:N-acetylmuramoyl-L-alanine amidase [Tenacibaculum maritimum]MDB0611256.1 N-acetylmuramoyl-L-alanine amidase [Tenacibaculum maritimum]
MRSIKYIVVHCTATKKNKNITAKDIDGWHKKRGWSGIGYHYVIDIYGNLEIGRPEWKMGAHVRGFNRHSLGVVYAGGLNEFLAPEDTRTPPQKKALLALLKKLKKRYPSAQILGHRDFSKDINGNGIIEPFEFMKMCPCYNAKEEYKNI